jgi:hypothetical protein
MMREVSLTVALILVLGLPVVEAGSTTNITNCTSHAQDKSENCSSVNYAMKCLFEALKLQEPDIGSPAILAMIKEHANKSLTESGFRCDLDYGFINGSKAEYVAPTTRAPPPAASTRKPEGPIRVDHDITWCVLEAITSGYFTGVSCGAARNVSKCVFREAGITSATYSTGESRSSIDDLNAVQDKFNLTCRIDYQEIVQELQREPLTTSPPSKYEDAMVVEDCFSVLKSEASVACAEAAPYTKCAVNVTRTNTLKISLTEFYPIASVYLSRTFTHDNVTCNLDAGALVAQAIKDLNGAQSLGPFHLFSLLVISYLSYVVFH